MDPLLSRYIDEVRSIRGNSEEDIAHLLARYLQEAVDDPRARTFLQAERFFYQKQYKEALQNYLQTKESAPDPFFSYRASACLLAERGQIDKALEFAKRALTLYTKDPDLLHLLKEQKEESQVHTPQITDEEEDLDAIAGFGVEPKFTSLSTKHPTLSGWKQSEVSRYLAHYLQKESAEDTLYLFDGFTKRDLHAIVTEANYQSSGGFFIRWKGEGIALNPGVGFLEQLHKRGFSLRDIDIVIVTSTPNDSWNSLKSIYEGHCQLHRAVPSSHTIHYYIASLGGAAPPSWLRPRFRQEADSIHPLVLYLDEEQRECRRLSDTLTLHYFPLSDSSIACLLELNTKEEESWKQEGKAENRARCMTIGYLPANASTFSHADFPWMGAFSKCSILLTSCMLPPSLLEQLQPKLAVLCEHDGSAGDMRLAKVQQTRKAMRCNTTLLPADMTLRIGLTPLCVYCSRTSVPMELEHVHVLPPLEPFSHLEYASFE